MLRRGQVFGLIGTVLLSIFLAIGLFATGANQLAGYTPGSFQVNELNGAAEYTIPIKTPVGIKGIEPHLSLKYSSQSGNGLLGLGWYLTGIPVITRRSTVNMRDGITHSVSYDTNDRFAINGNTLICVSGTYGQDGSVYRTERDEFSKIISYGTAGVGPSYFKVWTKDGMIMEFGNTTDSKVLAVGRSDVAVWPMNKIQDRCGNYMTVSYSGNSSGEYYTSCINYAYSPTARCSVVFQYETRQDSMLSYANSSLVNMTDRLHAIQTYVGTQMISNYQLGYQYGGVAQRSRLISITEYDGSGNSLPPTTFTYNTNVLGFQPQIFDGIPSHNYTLSSALIGDFTGKGKAQLIIRINNIPLGTCDTFVCVDGKWNKWATDSWQNNPNSQYAQFFVGDFNGDGLTDMLVIDNNGNAWVYLSNGNGFNGPYQWSTDGKILQNPSSGNMITRTADFNGDGMTDIVSVDKVNKKTYVWTSNGSGFDFHPDWFPGDNPGNYSNFDIGDFNGDGMTDIIVVQQNPVVWFSTGTGFNYQPNYGNLGQYANNGWMIWDMNGDGRADVCCLTNNNLINLSSGFGFPYSSSSNGPTYHDQQGDFNGDGVQDGIEVVSGNVLWGIPNSYNVSIWNGHGYVDYQWTVNGIPIATTAISPADFTGCGKAEVCIEDVNNRFIFIVPQDPTKEDIITSITDGLGKAVSITYKPLTDSSVYQKNHDAMYPIIRDYRGPIYVVSDYTVSNGLGGVNAYTYNYTGARIDTARRELLGFQSATLYDHQTGLYTSSTYLQGFPFSGLLKSKSITDSKGNIISSIANSYNVQCYDSGTLTETKSEDQATEWFIYEGPDKPSKSYFPYVSTSVKDDYLLTKSATPVTITEEVYSYLDYGDLQQKVTTVSTLVGSNTYDNFQETDTYQYYANDYGTNWMIGLVSQQTIQSTNNQNVTATRTTSYSYDTTHRLLTTETIEPSGDQTVNLTRSYAYNDAYFNLTQITETGYNGSATENRVTSFSYTYDPVEFHITKTNPAGLVEINDCGWETGKPTTYTDPNGLATDWYYDNFNRLEEIDRPDGTKTTFTYSSGGPVTTAAYSLQVQESGKAPVTTSFDLLDREIYQQTLAMNSQTISKYTNYNNLGLVAAKSRYYFSGGNAQVTQFTYDVLGRVIQQNAYNSGTTTYTYNLNGYNNVQLTNALSQTAVQTSNARGQLSQVVDALSKTTTYAYTPFGDLQQIKDSLGNTTTLTYDIRGRRTQVNDPDMGAWIYAYNAFGDLTSQTDAKANIVQMTYDKLSRVLTKISGSQNYSWTYDTATNGKGMPANVTGPAYQETYTYDSLARPQNVSTTLSGTTYTVTSSYDAYSRLSQLTYPSSGSSRFSAVYQYTANGYLQKVTSSSGITVYWTANTRNALGQVTEEALGNSLVTDNTFDPATGRLTAITTGSSVQSLSYTYDTLGNLLTREDNLKSLTETFTYDVANRVTGVTGPQNKTYSYNEIGNILNKSDVGAYTYGGTRPHAVTAAGGVNYTYDNNGNIISDSSGRNISFDGFNRPTQITKTGASGTLVYDAYDCLVEQILTKGSTTTTTIYIGNLFEQVTTGSVTEYKNYILAEGQQVATCDYYKGQGDHYIFYLHKDHLGSTDVTTNSSGGVVDGLSYDPFGMRRNATTWMDQAGITCSTTDYGYTGHIQLDTFGLIHMGARIYDPKLGRYISPDNVVQNVADSQALNRYSYCANNPLRYVDPTGNDFLDDLYNGACDLFSSGLDYLAAGFGSLNEYLTSLITPQPTLDLNSTLGLSSNSASTNTSFSSNLQQALSNAAAQAIDLGLQAATTAPSPEQSTQNVAATTTISTQVIPPPLLLAAANTGIANDANPAIYMNQSAQIAENQPTGTILADQGSNLINIAEGLLGQPYSKYDCSHLVWAVINMAGYYFPYTQTTNLPNSGLIDKIDPSQAQIGDIELFRHADGTPYHEGFYNPNSTAIGWQDNEQYPATLLQSSAKRGVSYSPDIWYGTPEYYRLKVPDQP